MSLLSVLNDIKTTLTTVGSGYAAHIADFIETDSTGRLIIPDDPDQFVITLITGAPVHQWGEVPGRTARVQVAAWSTTEGEPLVMLALAETALVAKRYIPLPVIRLGRDGHYTGSSQDFERGTT